MLDPIFIRRKIKLIQEDLKNLEQFGGLIFSEVARDWAKWNALEWVLAKIIGRAIDINQHLIAEMGGENLSPPKDYTETFLLLSDLKILPDSFATEIAKSAGFRNRIIHEYNDIDKNFVYQTVDEAIEEYAKYCRFVLEFLDKNNHQLKK